MSASPKPKVLFIFKLPPPVNGANLMNQTVHLSSLINDNFDCHYVDYGLSKKMEDFGKLNPSKAITYLKALFRVFGLNVTKKFSLLYITVSPVGFGFLKDSLFILLCRLFNLKTVVHLHGQGIRKKASNSPFWRFYYNLVFKKVYFICLTEILKSDVAFLSKREPFVVPNGIKRLVPLVDEKRLIKSPVTILFLSNLVPDKGIWDFIDSFSLLRQSEINTDIKGWIVGAETWIFEAELNQYLNDRGLNDVVTYLGPKYGREKNEVFEKSDIFVLPSKNEAFGLVNLEAMQFGLPVIATRVGGIPDIIDDGFNGFLIDINSPEQICNRIKKLILNPSLYSEMSVNAKDTFAKNYSAEVFEERLCGVIHELTNPDNHEYQ